MPKSKKAEDGAPPDVEISEESEDEVKSIIDDDEHGPKKKRRLSDAPERASPKRRRGRKSEMPEEDSQAATPARSARRKRSVPDLTPATTSRKNPSTPAPPKRKPRSTRRQSNDAAAEREIELELQYPSSSSPGGTGRAGLEEPAGSVPSVFGVPLLLQGGGLPEVAAPPTESTAPLPPHRARIAKPKVQRYEDPLLDTSEASSSAIRTKARLMRRNGDQPDAPQAVKSASTGPVRNGTRSARVSSTKAGPGRSSSGLITGGRSLLTAAGGALKSVTSRVIRPRRGAHPEVEAEELSSGVDAEGEPDPEEPPAPPPTGEELLQQAGYRDTDAQNLSDFEDDVDAHGEPDPDHPQSQERTRKEYVCICSTHGCCMLTLVRQMVVQEPEAEAEIAGREDHEVKEAPVETVEREVVGSTFRPWRASIFGPL